MGKYTIDCDQNGAGFAADIQASLEALNRCNVSNVMPVVGTGDGDYSTDEISDGMLWWNTDAAVEDGIGLYQYASASWQKIIDSELVDNQSKLKSLISQKADALSDNITIQFASVTGGDITDATGSIVIRDAGETVVTQLSVGQSTAVRNAQKFTLSGDAVVGTAANGFQSADTDFSTVDGVVNIPLSLGNGVVDSSALSESTDVNGAAVSTSHIQDDAVTLAKMDTDSVGLDQIKPDSVGSSELRVTGNGTSGQLLNSDGDGTMTWADAPSSGSLIGSTLEYDTWRTTPQGGGGIGSNYYDVTSTVPNDAVIVNRQDKSVDSGNYGTIMTFRFHYKTYT